MLLGAESVIVDPYWWNFLESTLTLISQWKHMWLKSPGPTSSIVYDQYDAVLDATCFSFSNLMAGLLLLWADSFTGNNAAVWLV